MSIKWLTYVFEFLCRHFRHWDHANEVVLLHHTKKTKSAHFLPLDTNKWLSYAFEFLCTHLRNYDHTNEEASLHHNKTKSQSMFSI